MSGKGRKIPQSVIGRTSKLFFSGAKVLTTEVVNRVAGKDSTIATRIRQTEELVKTLGELKGAAMKAGQLLSLELSDVLPPEVVAILRRLQDDTAFMPFEQVQQLLARQLGPVKLGELQDLSTKPIAAASIGQVHRATLHGKPVVVKVQYPGVAGSIDADLGVLRRIISLGLAIQGKSIDFEPVLKKLAESLAREADYRLEADNLEAYRRTVEGLPFVVPQVYRDYSTSTVLTMSYESGLRIPDWLASRPSPEEAAYVSRLVIQLLINEILTHGLVQSDPNFGNFLYRPDEKVLVLLDFGATVGYGAELRNAIRELTVSAAEGRLAEAQEIIHARGFLSREESQETLAYFRKILDLQARVMQYEYQPFAFNDQEWLADVRETTIQFTRMVEHTPPPEEVIFILRKLGGMHSLLKDLAIEIDMQPFVEKIKTTPIRDIA
jgi:aarF domain-containing kinase